MIRILANDGIHADAKKALENQGYMVDTEKIPQEELTTRLNEYDAIVVRSATKVRADLIDQSPNIKVIARAGVGLDNIDVQHAANKGIAVYNTPAASSTSVAELAMGHMMTLSRNLHHANRQMPSVGGPEFKALKKSCSKGFELNGKTLGIIGLGRIGQELARVGLALRMRVLPVDIKVKITNINIDLYQSDDVSLSIKMNSVPMEQMLAEADFISIHIPFSGGRAILGAEEMAKMKKGSFIINTARGGAVDEQALIDSIKAGHLGGAGLDVFENEPTPRKELIEMDEISLSPHVGGSTQEAQRNIGMELADKIIGFFNN